MTLKEALEIYGISPETAQTDYLIVIEAARDMLALAEAYAKMPKEINFKAIQDFTSLTANIAQKWGGRCKD